MEDDRIEYGRVDSETLRILHTGDIEAAVNQLELDRLALEYRLEDMVQCDDDDEGIELLGYRIGDIDEDIRDLKAGRKRAKPLPYDAATAEPEGKALSAHTFSQQQAWLRQQEKDVKRQKQARRQEQAMRRARGY